MVSYELFVNSLSQRETILRLVSEAKKHEKSTSQIADLQQAQDQLQTSLKSLEKERGDLCQRLAAAKETLAAQERELQAKERRYSTKWRQIVWSYVVFNRLHFVSTL